MVHGNPFVPCAYPDFSIGSLMQRPDSFTGQTILLCEVTGGWDTIASCNDRKTSPEIPQPYVVISVDHNGADRCKKIPLLRTIEVLEPSSVWISPADPDSWNTEPQFVLAVKSNSVAFTIGKADSRAKSNNRSQVSLPTGSMT
jgi:hypothetical protein